MSPSVSPCFLIQFCILCISYLTRWSVKDVKGIGFGLFKISISKFYLRDEAFRKDSRFGGQNRTRDLSQLNYLFSHNFQSLMPILHYRRRSSRNFVRDFYLYILCISWQIRSEFITALDSMRVQSIFGRMYIAGSRLSGPKRRTRAFPSNTERYVHSSSRRIAGKINRWYEPTENTIHLVWYWFM
jgi:hypothetical protein